MAARRCRPTGPRVIQGPGENAGVVDIGDGAVRRLQDGEPQPPLLHRALPGRGDRRRRHPARRLHHGRAADRGDERAALRRARPSEDPASRVRRRRRRRRLRQFLRRADRRRRGRISTRATTATSWSTPSPPASPTPTRSSYSEGQGRRPAGRLSRRQDRPRRRRRRHHGLGRIRRRHRGEAPDRAGRRPLHRKVPARSLPRADGDRRRHRHPGHGRGRPHLLGRRDGRQGRSRHRARPRQGAGARRAHDAPTR